MTHGYLPFGVGWYRKHFSTNTIDPLATVLWIDFEGVQSSSIVWLNGVLLGTHARYLCWFIVLYCY